MTYRTLQAIRVHYFGPSRTREAYLKATVAALAVELPWDDSLSIIDNHAAAAEALATKLNWLNGWHLVSGVLAGGDFVFVLVRNDD